jgi:hypothetical protein
MRRDLHGFVGHLDRLVPDLIVDDIYGRDRLTTGAAVKDLGAMTAVDLEHPEQFLWWNSKTQSNGAVTTHVAASTVRSSARYAAEVGHPEPVESEWFTPHPEFAVSEARIWRTRRVAMAV